MTKRRHFLLTVVIAVTVTELLYGVYDWLVIAQPKFALPLSVVLVLTLWLLPHVPVS